MDHPSSLLQIALDRRIFFALDRMALASNELTTDPAYDD
jgi:hypothetical protein